MKTKKIPHYVHFRCGRVHINISFKNRGISCKLQESLPEIELEHDEKYEDTWEEKENEWLTCLKNDVLSTAFSHPRYAKGMDELTRFGMKYSSIFTEFRKKISTV